MSPEEREAWLQANTFECPHGMGRIPPSQCEAYRARPTIKEIKGDWNLYRHRQAPVMPEACEWCEEWREKEGEKREVRGQKSGRGGEERGQGSEVSKKRKIRVCQKCGEEKMILARGACGACYQKARKAGKYHNPPEGPIEKFKKQEAPSSPDASCLRSEASTRRIDGEEHKNQTAGGDVAKIKQEPEQAVRLDFSGHPDLLEQLRKRADEQIRDLEQQILWELKTYSFEPALVEKELAWRLYGLAEETRQRQQEAVRK